MPKAPLPPIATLGINIGKNSFHLIGMNACVDAHHLSGQLLALGHDVKLIPAQFVKPFRKSHKNDFRDADAIAEAVQRPTMPSCRSRWSNSSTCKFLIVFVHGWRANARQSSTRSAPSARARDCGPTGLAIAAAGAAGQTRSSTMMPCPTVWRPTGSGTSTLPSLAGCAASRAEPSPNGFWENTSFRNYADYALTGRFGERFDRLTDLGGRSVTAIMCAEAVWWRCHRRSSPTTCSPPTVRCSTSSDLARSGRRR